MLAFTKILVYTHHEGRASVPMMTQQHCLFLPQFPPECKLPVLVMLQRPPQRCSRTRLPDVSQAPTCFHLGALLTGWQRRGGFLMLHPKLELGQKDHCHWAQCQNWRLPRRLGNARAQPAPHTPLCGSQCQAPVHLVSTRKLPRNGRLLSAQHPWEGSEKE